MSYKLEKKEKLLAHYQDFLHTGKANEDDLDLNYKLMREYLMNKYFELKDMNLSEYHLDLQFALALYEYLNSDKQKDFVSIYESDYNFWKYVAINVIPEIVADRHGKDAEEYFYSKGVRIYPYAMYWYIKLSWQGNVNETYDILLKNSTDEIMQVVERPSRIGINCTVLQLMMKKFSKVDLDNRKIVRNGKTYKTFRLLMIEYISKLKVYRPEFYPGGEEKFVDMIFEKVGVQVND